ncbi:helix-turn-helix domain-containing protein, partial [Myxococcota bacterium]
MPSTETLTAAGSLFIKATLLAAKWAGASRRKALESIASMSIEEKEKEIVFLRDQNAKLQMQVSILQKSANRNVRSPRYTVRERLHVLWFMEVYQIPRRKVTKYLGIARSTLYRWLKCIDDACPAPSPPHNRTPNPVAQLVWSIARINLGWGRVRIANQLGLLGVFLAASTVRNILLRPEPPSEQEQRSKVAAEEEQVDAPHFIRAPYPN